MDRLEPGLSDFLGRLADRGRVDAGVDDVVVSRFVAPDLGEVLHATGEGAARLDEAAFALTQGPAPSALRDRAPVFAADLTDPAELRRWPVWTATALEHGYRATAAFPVQIGAVVLGVVSFHRRRPGPFEHPAARRAAGLADAVTVALLDTLAGVPFADADAEDSAAVRRDLASTRLYQASGMVMVQLGVDATQALLALRVHAFAEGRSLRDVADDVLAHRKRFRKGDDPA